MGCTFCLPTASVCSSAALSRSFLVCSATPQAQHRAPGGGRAGTPDTEDMGSGPFVLKGWIPETAMVLHRNPEVLDARCYMGAPLPYLDGIAG